MRIVISPEHRKSGFTLVELIVVIGIVGILATLSIPAYDKYAHLARITRCTSDIRVYDRTIVSYQIEKGTLPSTATVLSMTGKDPWGNPYEYRTPSTYIDGYVDPVSSDYDFFSKGRDGASTEAINVDPTTPSTSDDDIVRGHDGAYVGLGSLYWDSIL